jgi:hypothetical protein
VPRNELKIPLVRMAAIDCPMIRNSWKAGPQQPEGGILGGISKLESPETLISCGLAGMIWKTSTRHQMDEAVANQ